MSIKNKSFDILSAGNFDSADGYFISIHDKILKLAPVIGACAACTFTAAWLLGKFEFVELPLLIAFDVICLLYFVAAYALRRSGILVDGKVSEKSMLRTGYVLAALVLLQWNLISYIFPMRSLWGYAPMFVLLTAFMFQSHVVFAEIMGLIVSIAVSWFVKGEQLLPVHDEYYEENLTLRVVALGISFIVIYMLTFFSEKFTVSVKENYNSLEEKNKELESMGKDVIDFTADIIEERDSTSGSHVKRMKAYTEMIARQIAGMYPEYGLTEEKIQQIATASVLHDIGKIAISDTILLKPGRLTEEEFNIIKTHTTLGARILDKLPDSLGKEYKAYCREICLYHHEKVDGKGYPAGLVGDEIPISAQIVSVVDCYDALTNERPYKQALPGDVAINMILEGKCGAFSDKMKACIIQCKDKLLVM